ncbi:hypothetical protein MTO96_007880 [Rhipicephalus appendiculatus]
MALSGCRTEDFAFVAEDGWTSRTLSAPKSRLPPEYPSEWFAAHPGSKPIAIVKRCFASEEHLAKVVSAGLAAGRLPVEYVVQFMHVEGAKIKDTLTEDWKSFGVTIGSAGETISPWDLLSITEQSGPADLADAAVAATADDDNSPHRAGLLAVVVCIYRLLVAKCRGGRREYLQRLQDKALKRILMQFRVGSQYLVEAENNFEHWLKDRSYLSLIAALDMFLHRFRNHDMALLRAGTQVSRYKHCAVLDDLGRVCKETGLKGLELFQWIFFRQAADELFVIYEGGQELLSKNSYAPYLSDLGLSRRSPYSATANPFLHYWCNAASALLGSFKSPKSIVPCDVDFSGATVNAMVLAYATEIIRDRPRPICTINEAQAKLLSNILLNRLNTPQRHWPNA